MAIYSIKDLEKLCGIKAHTLRIWEQRYGIVIPKRTPTNIRYYEDEDLKTLLNVALLNRNGYKISKIAVMGREEMLEKVTEISEVNFENNTQLDALTISMIEMDEYKFDRIISSNINQIGFEKTMIKVILPFLDKLSVLWLTGSINPVQENFISYLIRQKIISAIDKVPLMTNGSVKKLLLYLPENESQELSLLFVHYLLRNRNCQVIYLGQNISLVDLQDAYEIHKPDFVFTMLSESFSSRPVQQYLDEIVKTFPQSKILLSGYQVVAQHVQFSDQIIIFNGLEELVKFADHTSKGFSFGRSVG